MAKMVGISVSSVQRVWQAHGLQPNRVHRFKLSKHPEFVPKLREIVGLYVRPASACHRALGRREIANQALDRT